MEAEAPAHLQPFASSVLSLLSIWPALSLIFDHSPPKPPLTPSSLTSELATELVGAFLDASPSEPALEEVEDFLVGWVLATLEVRVEDDSEVQIARDLGGMWKEWSAAGGDSTKLPRDGIVERVEAMARRKSEKRRLMNGRPDQGSSAMVNEDGEETDNSSSDTDGDDGDDMMVDAPRKSDKPVPEVDDEGFTMVTSSRRR